MSARELITEHLDLWTGAVTHKSSAGRGSNGKVELTGIKKLRELILELAVRGKLVEQDPDDEPANVLLERIAEEKARLVKEGKIKKPKKLPEIPEEQKPFALPDKWAWARLPEVYYSISTSGRNIKSSEVSDEGEFPVVDQGQSHITGYHDDESLVIQIPNPVVVFGDHTTARKYIDFDFIAGADGTKILSPTLVEPRYFYLHLLEYDLENRGYARHFKVLNEQLFAIPPLNEQLKIVEKVDELMALCDRLERQVGDQQEAHEVLVDTLLDALISSTDAAELAENWARIAEHFDTLFTTEASIDKLKQTILQLAVMGRLVPQDPDDEPASVLLERIAEEKARLVREGKIKKPKKLPPTADMETSQLQLPRGWATARLGEIIQISSGDGLTSRQMNNSGNIPVYGGNGVTGMHDKANVFESTLVIGRVGFYCGSIHVTPEEAWVTDNAFITHFSPKLFCIEFLSMLLRATNLKENENATAQPVISGRKIYPIAVSFPPPAEQHRIVEKVDELTALCDRLKARLGKAGETRTHLAETVVEQAVS